MDGDNLSNEGDDSSDNIDDNNSLKRSGKHMSSQKKIIIFEFLLERSKDLKLEKGSITLAATKFQVPIRTIRIWSTGKKNFCNGIDFSSGHTRNAGRKRVIDFSMVKDIDLSRRSNIRSLADALNVPKSTIHRRIKEGYLRPHSNSIKTFIMDENMKVRLRYYLSMIIRSNTLNASVFSSMMDVIHLDEKWFYMTKKSQRYYLHPDESIPLRTCKSLNFIDKIMFLAVVARPRFDPIRNEMFSGKIGIFPFVIIEPAKRKSKNRPAGTLETKPLTTVTKDVTRRFLIDKVLPVIRSKWPDGNSSGTIYIQQDNAKPHIKPDDPEFMEVVVIDGFDICLCFKPPNSPDLNVLDLGFFRAIQTLQHEQAPTSIDDLVAVVEKSFLELEHEKLDKIFLALQLNMIEIMKVGGNNNYKQPHFSDEQCPHGSPLPLHLKCDEVLINSMIDKLSRA